MIAPDGARLRKLTSRKVHGFAFSRDGAQVYGIFHNIARAPTAALLDRRENRRGEYIDSVDRDFDRKVHVLRNRNGFSGLPRGRDEALAGGPEDDPAAASNGIGCSVEGVVVIQRPCLRTTCCSK